MISYRLYTFIFCMGLCLHGAAMASPADEMLLPPEYKVYFKEGVGVVNHQFDGAAEKVLPTKNEFKGKPGCYIACYSRKPIQSVYPVSKDIFVMGQIRVEGSYKERICQPKGFEGKDISKEVSFKDKCAAQLPQACSQSNCWAGGDTGGWFGIQ